ncbi:Genetic suppressor element 1 [Larimichthys crocea]|uniref:Uncharacterized protein n=1 Tax=Larimichthys crocea TaxID=215358 RepID=A0ACD3QCZ8_LARCR|nr:Genetic suppressor element 1 [Larimichthys crocea]
MKNEERKENDREHSLRERAKGQLRRENGKIKRVTETGEEGRKRRRRRRWDGEGDRWRGRGRRKRGVDGEGKEEGRWKWIEKRSRDHVAAARLRERERERGRERERRESQRGAERRRAGEENSEREGMNHESNKSPSLGMISTATRTTATVSPLSPLTNGNAVAQSANSGFAAALRKLAKQAEDPRGSAISGESSPVSSPATSHSSPVTTPKRGSLGPLLAQTRGHGVPNTPPVVTIAPTKTSNGLWRADGRQVEPSVQGLSRERVGAENTQPQQDKRTPPTPSSHPLAHPFGLTPSSIMQDPRIQSLSLPGQMHPVVPSGAVPEEYLRALRPFATSDDLRLSSLPLSLDPAAAAHAAAAAAYYHPAYLHHPLSLPRMEESLCLSALRSQFYSVPAGGAFPPLHPSALHLHLPGGRYPGELNHTALAERGTIPHPVPSLVPSHMGKHHAAAGGIHGALAAAMMTQRASEAAWLTRQRGQGQEREENSTLLHHQVGRLQGLTRADRPPLSWGDKLEDGGRRKSEGTERYTSLRGASLQEAGSWTKTEQDRAIQSLYHRHHISSLQQRSCVPPDLVGQHQAASPSPVRERQSQPPDSMLVYDEVLQQHRRLLSKLDLEEKRRKEAREGGYYYDLDESYDESDEEEVKAHLRRVTEQPPLKLDTSSEKVDFLRVCGLTTLAHRDELLARKRRKRRRMMRERSLSPPAVRGKRKASSPSTPTTPLTTPYSAEQMDSTPELEEKKDFLLMFNLSHVSPQQRRVVPVILRGKLQHAVSLSVVLFTEGVGGVTPHQPLPPCQSNGHLYPDSPSPSPPHLHKPKRLLHNDTFKPSVDNSVAHIPPPLTLHHEKAELNEAQPNRKHQGLQNGVVASPQKKEPSPMQNGRNRALERFTPEAFAQHFHQAVLQSTHTSLQNKAVSNCAPEAGMKADRLLPHSVSQLKSSNVNHASQHSRVNGHHLHFPAASRHTPGPQENLSDEDEEESGQEEEDEEEEMEEAPKKWQGIEAIFEAYQEYVDEWSIERQVLHGQCKRLEAQNYNLTRTAEQLSVTMGELVTQRQKVREERERLQAQLEHFRRCLTLPNIHWGRGQVNGHTLR